MKKKLTKVSITKSEADKVEYWLNKTPEEKLNALQELREQYIYLFNKKKLYYESRKSLRRVYKIIKLSFR